MKAEADSGSTRWRTTVALGSGSQALFADNTLTTELLQLPGHVADGIVQALQAGATEDELLDIASQAGAASAARWLQVFDVLCRVGRALPSVGTALGDLEVVAGAPTSTPAPPATSASAGSPLRLSRWAYMTPAQEGHLWVEEPAVGVRALLHAGLLAGVLVGDPRARVAIDLCRTYGILVATDDPQESWWEPHDRYFHWRTRRDTHAYVNGATFPYDGERPPLPVSPSLRGSAVVTLPSGPSREGEAQTSLATVLARRTTTRECDEPVAVDDIAAFLSYHRVLAVSHEEARGGGAYPQSRRLYPGGGATYELELCITTSGVAGLADGIWWFDAVGQSLVLLTDDAGAVAQVVDDALTSTGGAGTPRAIITYVLRMGRNSWKYEGMAYRLALLDAGVLYHHAYLVGAELGIGVCGLGNGNSALFSKLIRQDQEAVTSVAEVMLTGRLTDEGRSPIGPAR